MKRKGARAVIVGIAVVLVLALALPLMTACPAPEVKAERLTIFTGGVAGTYYPLGGVLQRIIDAKVEGVSAAVVSSGASVANCRHISDGVADLALIQNDTAAYAYKGIEMFDGKPVKNIRGIAGWYPETIQIVTLEEFNIKTIADLVGKKVGIGAPGSGTAVEALAILGAAGITSANANLQNLDFAEVAMALKDRTIDAGVIVAGFPTAAVTDVATTRNVYIVEIPDDIYNTLRQKAPYFVRQTIPAGTYKGLGKDVKSVAVLAMLVCRAELDEKLVYNITKAMFENLDQFVATHARGKDIQLEKALDGMPIPLHPGAEKYYKEKGLIK